MEHFIYMAEHFKIWWAQEVTFFFSFELFISPPGATATLSFPRFPQLRHRMYTHTHTHTHTHIFTYVACYNSGTSQITSVMKF
jgi:hypothetical protein